MSQLNELLESVYRNILETLRVSSIAKIVKINESPFSIDVEIIDAKFLSTQTNVNIPYSIIKEVPILFANGSAGGLNIPLSINDNVALIACDSNLATFLNNFPKNTRNQCRQKHSLNNCFAIPFAKTNSQTSSHSQSTVSLFSNQGARVDLDSLVSISNNVTSFITLLSNFITALKGLSVVPTTGILTPESIASLEAILEEFKTLFK